ERGEERFAVGERHDQQAKCVDFGPRFRNLRAIWLGDGEALAELALPEPFSEDTARYGLHPALLDLATGFALRVAQRYDTERLYVPVEYERIRVYRPLPGHLFAHARLRSESEATGGVSFDVTLCDADGARCTDIEGFHMRRVEASAFTQSSSPTFRVKKGAVDAPSDLLSLATAEGIVPEEGLRALRSLLASQVGPVAVVSSIDLTALEQYVRRSG